MEEWGAQVLGPAFNANIISHRLYFPTQLLVPLLRSNSNNQLTGLDNFRGLRGYPEGLDGTLRFAHTLPHSSNLFFVSLHEFLKTAQIFIPKGKRTFYKE
jgi:hypothetical protein